MKRNMRSIKRLISVALCAIMTISLTALPMGTVNAAAEGYGDYLYYILDENSVAISSYSGSETDVVIPSDIEGKTVAEIGDYAFQGCTTVENVSIPDSVTSILNFAFSGCTALSSVRLPDSLTQLGVGMFEGCTSLESIGISDSNTQYAAVDGALYDKEITTLICWPCGKTEVTLPETVTQIGGAAFYGCTLLNSVALPDTVTNIGYRAFKKCEALETVDIPDATTQIGDAAFSCCDSLKSITLPESLTYFGKCVFNMCGSLENIGVADGNEYFASVDGVLYDKDKTTLICWPCGKKEVTFTDTVTRIADCAFYGCRSIKKAVIPETVTEIGSEAFFDCESLSDIMIPSSVTAIGNGVFDSCSLDGLRITAPAYSLAIDYALANGIKCSLAPEFGCLDLDDGTKKITTITLSDTTWVWGEYGAWSDWQNSAIDGTEYREVESRWITNYKTQYNYSKWTQNSNGTGWTGPSKGTWSGNYCGTYIERGWSDSPLAVCDTSQGFNIYGTLGKDPWYNETTRQVENGGYTQYRCRDRDKIYTNYEFLRTVVFPSDENVTVIGEKILSGYEFLEDVIFPDTLKVIENDAFSLCPLLTSVTLPKSLSGIGANAFNGCESLETVTIPSQYTEIDDGAFLNCPDLTFRCSRFSKAAKYAQANNIPVEYTDETFLDDGRFDYEVLEDGTLRITKYVGNGVTVNIPAELDGKVVSGLGDLVFNEDESLENVTIPSSVVNISQHAFDDCYSLESINADELNEAYTSEDGVLYSKDMTVLVRCPAMRKSIIIPDTVTLIGEYAFRGCDSLSIVSLPDSVTNIADEAFSGCEELYFLYIPDSVAGFGQNVFYDSPVVLRCSKGSAAYAYARDHGMGFELYPKPDISYYDISLSQTTLTYDGSEKTPSVVVYDGVEQLDENTDFVVEYSNNIDEGTGYATVSGIGNYEGYKTLEFSIVGSGEKINIENLDIELSATRFLFDGTEQRPAITVRNGDTVLTEYTDYAVSYYDNIYIGEARAVIMGIGDYEGEKTVYYQITDGFAPGDFGVDIAQCTISLSEDVFIYDGSEKKPTVTVKDGEYVLEEGTDYTVSYYSNIYAGVAEAEITGIGMYRGTRSVTFTIEDVPKTDIYNCTVILERNIYGYDGYEKTPAVTVMDGSVTLVQDKDYTVEYYNNVEIGSAFARVYGIGYYEGYIDEYFSIVALEEDPTVVINYGIMGDVDGDGSITAADAVAVLRASAGLQAADEKFTVLGDVDEDGYLTTTDALLIMRYSIGLFGDDRIGETITREVSAVTKIYILDETDKGYKLNLYYWGNGLSCDWPGTELTDKDGDGWLEVSVPSREEFNWLIVDEKGAKSSDFTSDADTWIVMRSLQKLSVYDEKPAD